MDVLGERVFQKEVDTVRALHQTVVSLRAALERSRVEIEELKERIWSSESCELALQTLSVENHVLRQKIIGVNDFKETTTQTSLPYITVDSADRFENKQQNKEIDSIDLNQTEKSYLTINDADKCAQDNSLASETKNSPKKTAVTFSDNKYSPRENNFELNSPKKNVDVPRKSNFEFSKSPEKKLNDSKEPASRINTSPERIFDVREIINKNSPIKSNSDFDKSPKKKIVSENVKSPRRKNNTELESPIKKTNFTINESTKSPQKDNLEFHTSPKKGSLVSEKKKSFSPRENNLKFDTSPKRRNIQVNVTIKSPRKEKIKLDTSPRLKLEVNENLKSPEKHLITSSPNASPRIRNSETNQGKKPSKKNYENTTNDSKSSPKINLNSRSPKSSPRTKVLEPTEIKKSPKKEIIKSEKLEPSTSNAKNSLKKTKHNEAPESSSKTCEEKSPKKNPIVNILKSPRKTILTVNLTIKSPKKNIPKTKETEISAIVTEKSETDNSDSNITQKSLTNSKNASCHDSASEVTSEKTSTSGNMEEDNREETKSSNEEQENIKTPEQKESDTEADEVDDIELIFTTDETTINQSMKEELVSIADGDGDSITNSNEVETECDTPVLLNYRTVDFDTTELHLSTDNMDKDLDDDVFHETDNFENENTENLNFQNSSAQIHNSKSDNSINRDSIHTENDSQRDKSLKSCYSYQDSSFESRSLDKDESFDKFDDKDKYLHKMWSNNSVLVETDISKCGIVDPEMPISSARRNTCPNPVPYRPIMHREAIAKHNTRTLAVKFTSSPRPILNETQSPKTESEAQTDISALPSLWKSESYLAHKVAHQFTTLPSKFPMPMSQKSLRLSEKTKEARRVLLSDINFTSMVPELSRSADHLYQEGLEVMQSGGYGQYLNPPGPQLRRYNTGDSLTSPSFVHSQKFNWSPSDYSNFSSNNKFDNSNMYLNRYKGSLTSINMQNSFDLPDNVKRRSYSSSHWRQNVPASFDNSRFMHAGHGQYRSVPNSPTRSRSVPFISSYGAHAQQQYPSAFRHSQTRFHKQGYSGVRYMNGSLPELHGDMDSGDSTDSLVEEAEQYLRSSIDCIVSGRDMTHMSRSTKRRASAPCSGRESSPPRNWVPFLPHGIKDLRSDNWVKVIGPEGKIRGGRVRYVGYVLGQQEPFVGIELPTSSGNTDGTFNNRRYFDCSPNHALFIPFKKVVMGWRN